MTSLRNVLSRLRNLLWLWALMIGIPLGPSATFAYDGSNQAMPAYDIRVSGRGLGYDSSHVFATGENKCAIIGDGVLFARFAKFLAAEGTALRFTQTTASPWFSAEGKFAGQTISDVAAQLRAGTLTAADVPVTVVGDGLIVNTRSSLALTQAGIPQAQWTLVRGTAQEAADIAARLARNGLGPNGTDVLRITGSGKGASTLIGSGTIPRP